MFPRRHEFIGKVSFRQNMMDQQNEQINIYEQDIEILKEQVSDVTQVYQVTCEVRSSVCVFRRQSFFSGDL